MPQQSNSSVGDTLVKGIKDSFSSKPITDALSGAVDKAKSFVGLGQSKPPADDAKAQALKVANDAFAKRVQDQRNEPDKSSSKSLPKYKNGTDYVQKTGPAILHKGEAVLTKEEAAVHRANKRDSDDPKGASHSDRVSLHRALNHLNKGGLHRALGIPEGQPIPQDKLEAAKHSDNPHIAKMAQFASTMEGWHHK